MGSFSLAVFLSSFPFVFPLLRPWKLRLNLSHCCLSSRRSFYFFISLLCGQFCLPSAVVCVFFFFFFLWMSITTLGLWRLSMLRHLQISFFHYGLQHFDSKRCPWACGSQGLWLTVIGWLFSTLRLKIINLFPSHVLLTKVEHPQYISDHFSSIWHSRIPPNVCLVILYAASLGIRFLSYAELVLFQDLDQSTSLPRLQYMC